MMGDQLPEPFAAESCAQRTLDQVDVRPAIALDQARAVCSDSHIPSDHDPVVESRMRPSNQVADIVPHWQLPSVDRSAGDGMPVDPAPAGIEPSVCGLAQSPSIKVD